MGLLDGLLGGQFSDEPEKNEAAKMAMLAASLGLLTGRGRNFLDVAGQAGMQGMQAYGGTLAATKAQQEKEAERRQREQLQGLQMQQAQMQLAQAQRGQEMEQKRSDLLPQFVRPGQPMGDMPGGGDRPVQYGPSSFDQPGYVNALLGAGDPAALSMLPKPTEAPKLSEWQQKVEGLVNAGVPRELAVRRVAGYDAAPAAEAPLPADWRLYKSQKPDGNYDDYLSTQERLRRSGATSVSVNSDNLGLKPKDRFEMEGKMRDDFQQQSKVFSEISQAKQRFDAAFDAKGGVRDIAAVYSLAKILDPTSVVRESEYAAVVNAQGLADRAKVLLQKAIDGTFLSDSQRDEIGKVINGIYSRAEADYKRRRIEFERNARQYNLAPENVVPPMQSAPDLTSSERRELDELRRRFGR